jgi:hypothetical protein
MKWQALGCVALLSVTFVGCKKPTNDVSGESPNTPKQSSSIKKTDTPPTTASAAHSTETPPGAAPLCVAKNHKSWGTNINTLTGLTTKKLVDGRVAVGLAIGYRPHVLIVDKNGEGKLVRVPVAKDGILATVPKSDEGMRKLWRVTPSEVKGEKAAAFADFQDIYKNGKRVVVCGPADSKEPWLSFEGMPLIDSDPEKKDTFNPKGTKPDLSKFLIGMRNNIRNEIRDCRSFSNLRSGKTWVISSVLSQFPHPNQTPTYEVSLQVIGQQNRTQPTVLHKREYDPSKSKKISIPTYAVPVSAHLMDGHFVFATRFGGSLLTTMVDENFSKLIGRPRSYLGWPTIGHFTRDKNNVMLSAGFGTAKGKLSLRAMIISHQAQELPAKMTDIVLTEDKTGSEHSPEFLLDRSGQWWLSYTEGERPNAKLYIVPINKSFQTQGHPHRVTGEQEHAEESRLVTLRGGGFLAVYIRKEVGKPTELITETLDCTAPAH